MNHNKAPPLPTAAWMDLAVLLPPFTTWVYMGLLWFHLPYNWAAHSCMAIQPCRLPPAGHGVQLVERPFLAVPTWSACCQIMVRPEDFPLRKDEKGFFDRPTFHIQYLDNAQIIYGWDHPYPQIILLRAQPQHSRWTVESIGITNKSTEC